MRPIQRFREFYRNRSPENLFRLDGAVRIARAIPFGLQHVLSMFVSNIVPIIICMTSIGTANGATAEVINNSVRAAIFMAAIGTTIQLYPVWRIGARLPIVVGVSFTFLGGLTLIGTKYGLGTMFLSIIFGGIAIGILGLFAHKWKRFVKPIVSAVVILGIGFSLLQVGISDFLSLSSLGVGVGDPYPFDRGWPFLLVAFITLIVSILWQCLIKGIWKNVSILVGLIVGYLVALCFPGMVNFSSMAIHSVADVINVPRPFFTLVPVGVKDINFGAIAVLLLIYLVATTEGLGDIASLTDAGLGREPTDREISGGIAADGIISSLSGFFGGFPLTTFAQNVGIVGQTKVVNRFVVFQGALLLFVASFFPPISAFFLTVPSPVLGGSMIMLFASILVIGMQMASKVGFSRKNVMILSLSIGLGYGITLVPGLFANDFGVPFLSYLWIILQNPVANMFIIAFILSYVIPESINGPSIKQENSNAR